MNLKKNQNKATDIAWNKLYERFEQESLIPIEDPESSFNKVFLERTSVRWGVVAAVTLLCVVSVLFIYKSLWFKTDLLTLENTTNVETLVTTLEDGSIVYLSKAASLNYPAKFQEDKREVVLQGNAFFDISKSEERPFFIDTKVAQIEVLGTAFNVVSEDNKQFSLSVKEGKVKVILKKTGQEIYVNGGETVILLESENLQKTDMKDIDVFDEYTKKIHFKDERLADIIHVINLNSDINLELSPDLADRKLTVTFLNNTPMDMAELICMAMDLKCVVTENYISIESP